MTRIVILALLCSCVMPVPVSKDRLINVSIDAWDAKGLPYTQLCADTRESLIVQITDDPESICGEYMEHDGTFLAGCFLEPRNGSSPILVATSDPDYDTDVIVHEAMHWLSWCSLGDGDADHANPEVWSLEGAYYEALARVIP